MVTKFEFITVTDAFPSACEAGVPVAAGALGIKIMESGTVSEDVPERNGVTEKALLDVSIVYPIPQGIAVCTLSMTVVLN